jgi:nitrogen fixation NifU-like protein
VTMDRSTPALGSLYQEVILEHFKRPRNRGELADPHADVHMVNPVCGDEVRLQLRMDGERIGEARFTGQGCSISQASASMMTQIIKGRTPAEVEAIAGRFKAMLRGDEEAARDAALGDLRALAGVSRYPARVKCALLGWNALEEGLKQVQGG